MRSFFSVLFLISLGYAFLAFIFPEYFLFWTDKSRRNRLTAFFAGSSIVLLSVAGGILSPLENFSVRASIENGTETVLDSVRFRGISPSDAEILINNQKILFYDNQFYYKFPLYSGENHFSIVWRQGEKTLKEEYIFFRKSDFEVRTVNDEMESLLKNFEKEKQEAWKKKVYWNQKYVSADTFWADWPLTVKEGILTCYPRYAGGRGVNKIGIRAVTFRDREGNEYYLEFDESCWGCTRNIKNVLKPYLEDGSIQLSLKKLILEGRELCGRFED
ncbi:MAG TPA: hypothetical protein PKK05_16600 [Leptospiraceae bacterium]|nr:hypothetical protein [Leptospiraceae bacterium]